MLQSPMNRRVRFKAGPGAPSSRTWQRPHVVLLVICILVLVVCVNFFLHVRRSGDAWWTDYEAVDEAEGGDAGRRGLGRATGEDGVVDAAYRHASHDKAFLADQHHHKHAADAAGAGSGNGRAGVQRQGAGGVTQGGGHAAQGRAAAAAAARQPVMVSYAYHEEVR